MATQNTTNVTAKNFNLVIKRGGKESEILNLSQGAGDRGQPLRIKAEVGAKYEVQELVGKNGRAPEFLKVKRVGKDLHLTLEGDEASDVILESYYEVMPEGYNGIIGQAENGSYYEYVPESAALEGFVPSLKDGADAISVVLGGTEVTSAGAAVAGFGLTPLLGGAGAAVGGAVDLHRTLTRQP